MDNREQMEQARGFNDALDIMLAQYRNELEVARSLGAPYQERQAMRDAHWQIAEEVDVAKRIYRENIRLIAEKIRQQEGQMYRSIADALEHNDFTTLAV